MIVGLSLVFFLFGIQSLKLIGRIAFWKMVLSVWSLLSINTFTPWYYHRLFIVLWFQHQPIPIFGYCIIIFNFEATSILMKWTIWMQKFQSAITVGAKLPWKNWWNVDNSAVFFFQILWMSPAFHRYWTISRSGEKIPYEIWVFSIQNGLKRI